MTYGLLIDSRDFARRWGSHLLSRERLGNLRHVIGRKWSELIGLEGFGRLGLLEVSSVEEFM